MKYIIDHSTQSIHQSTFVGDRCDLHTTPLSQREGTHSYDYIVQLMSQQHYQACAYCSLVQK
ncbi:hypothetical protein [Pontibacillus halophilus]|uniref:hypothetical protein n=1 Tax=Pontibacillus halophilus TaxID=516704 RepID=UPI0012B61037|nr:hypothetical protein [Pontibacillus halophilus]